MRETLRSVPWLAASAAAWLGLACARAPVEVAYDREQDLSRFRTWDWIEGEALVVHTSEDPAGIEARLAAEIEEELRQRGLERAPGSGELRVAALLVVQRSYQAIRHSRALETVYSYHDVGTWEVQSEVVERRPIDRCRFAVYITGPGQRRLLWQAQLEERYTNGFARHLDEAVEKLLDSFPPR